MTDIFLDVRLDDRMIIRHLSKYGEVSFWCDSTVIKTLL